MDEGKILYEALTEVDKMVYNHWNFVTLAYCHDKKRGIVLTLNGKQCLLEAEGKAKLASKLLSDITIGSKTDNDQFKGEVRSLLLLNFAITTPHVQALLKLGVGRETWLGACEESSYRAVDSSDRQLLREVAAGVVFNVNPIVADGEIGAGVQCEPPFDVPGQQMTSPPPERELRLRGVSRLITSRMWDCLRVIGGPMVLLPYIDLLPPSDGAVLVLNDFLRLIADYCAIPNQMMHAAVMKGLFAEMMSMVVSDVADRIHFDENIISSLILLVDNLDWSRECKGKVFEKLLLNFSLWHKLHWNLQRMVSVNIVKFLANIYQEMRGRHMALKRAFEMLGLYYSLFKTTAEKRYEFVELIKNQLIGQTPLGDEEAREILSVVSTTLCTFPKDLVDLLQLQVYLERNELLRVSASVRTDINTLLLHIIRKGHKLKLTNIQSLALEAVRVTYIDRTVPTDLSDMSVVSFPSAPVLLETLNSCLGDSLNNDLYDALLHIMVVPGSGSLRVRHPEALDLICSRLTQCNCLEMIFHELTYLARFQTRLIYDRTTFPAWTLSLFVANSSALTASSDPKTEMLIDLTIIIFTNILQSIEHAANKLRAFFLSLLHAHHSVEWTEKVVFQLVSSLLDSLLRTFVDSNDVRQLVYHNIHELCDILEDMLTARPGLSELREFPDLVFKLVQLAQKLRVAASSYPPLPELSMLVLNKLYRETPPQPAVNWNVTRLREGGMFRTLLKFVLVAMQKCDGARLPQLLDTLCVLVGGDRAKKQLFSAFSASYQIYCENLLREPETKDRYPYIFANYPKVAPIDLLFSEEFMVVFLFTEVTELVLDRRHHQLSYEPLLLFIKELVKYYKLGHFLNQLLTTESAESRAEFVSFETDFFLDIVGCARQLHRDFNLLHEFGGDAEGFLPSAAGDLLSFKAKALKLMMNLNLACGGTLDGILQILKSRDWLETVQLYLLCKTSMKLQVVERAVSFFPSAPQLALSVLRPDTNIQTVVKSAVSTLKKRFITEREERSRNKSRNDDLDAAFHRSKWRKLSKTVLETPDFFESEEGVTLFMKVDFLTDAEMRHCNLKMNHKGTSHDEAINKKYRKMHSEDAPTPHRRVTIIATSGSEAEEIRRQLLKTLPKPRYSHLHISPRGTRRVSEVISEIEDRIPTQDAEVGSVSESEEEQMDTAQPEPDTGTFIDTPEESVDSSPCGDSLRIECERISVRGSLFGTLELTKRYLIFRSSGEKKPTGKYFGSALAWTQLTKTKEQVWELTEFTEIFGRRFLHRHTAIECFLRGGRSYFFNCFTSEARESVVTYLRESAGAAIKLHFDPARDFANEKITSAWKHGKLSNFEYLMLVNRYASRSTNDLNQYPVFPWILTNYSSDALDLSDPSNYRDLSLPVGAIDPDSREDCINRYEHWINDDVMKPFHYGSHYSTGGIVLHYMLRLEPYTTQAIALQDGQFDVADRLFSSVDIAWKGSLKNAGDFKELIPEFFFLPEFLVNMNGYQLGQSQALEPVNHIVLPKWAKNPHDFIRIHRAALESSYVSEHLHEWIDLVFGCKQFGEEAVRAINVFFSITYEQNVKHLFTDPQPEGSLEGVIEQIAHYGQTPVQIFKKEHPRRNVRPQPLNMFDELKKPAESMESTLLWSFAEENEMVVGIYAQRTKLVLATSTRRLKFMRWKTNEALRADLSYNKDTDISLEGVQHTPQALSFHHFCIHGEFVISGMYYDNTFKVHSLADGALKLSVSHHINMVSCVVAACGHVIAGSFDSTISVWNLAQAKDGPMVASLHFALTGQMSGIKQCCVDAPMQICVSLALDGAIAVHSLLSGLFLRKVKAAGQSINCIALSCSGLIAFFKAGSEVMTVVSRNAAQVTTIPLPKLDEVTSMSFSADGSMLLLAGTQSLSVAQIFGDKGHQVKRCLQDYPVVVAVALPDQQNLLISLQNRSVCRVELQSRRPVRV